MYHDFTVNFNNGVEMDSRLMLPEEKNTPRQSCLMTPVQIGHLTLTMIDFSSKPEVTFVTFQGVDRPRS